MWFLIMWEYFTDNIKFNIFPFCFQMKTIKMGRREPRDEKSLRNGEKIVTRNAKKVKYREEYKKKEGKRKLKLKNKVVKKEL